MVTIAVVGDVGGHRRALADALHALGARPDGTGLPDGLLVVQVGDLVDRGPDSAGVLALVDRIMTETPDRWIQLVGNHEQRHVHRPVFAWPERLDDASVSVLRRWWDRGAMRPAASFTDADGRDWLVTHGGLTAEYRRDVLGRPETAREAARRINALAADERLWRPGVKLTGAVDRWAGPVWADAGSELYPSWLARYASRGAPPPFGQVHGHSQAANWTLPVPAHLAGHLEVDGTARHQRCTVGGVPLVGVDPQHGRTGATRWAPLLFPDARPT